METSGAGLSVSEVRHIKGAQNVVADELSRLNQVDDIVAQLPAP